MCLEETKKSEPKSESFLNSPTLWFCILMIAILILSSISSCRSRKQFDDSCRTLCQLYGEHVSEITLDYHQWQEERVANANVISTRIENLLDSLSKLPVRSQRNLTDILRVELEELMNVSHVLESGAINEEIQNYMKEISLNQHQMTTHLQLHLDKIDRGYSSMETWAAVLTIIFLVFSFYSLFKMEDFMKQGADGVKDIKRLKNEGDDYLKDIKQKISYNENKLTEELEGSKKKFNDEANNRMQQIIDQKQLFDEELNKMKGQYEAERMTLFSTIKQFEDDKQKMIYQAQMDFDKEVQMCRDQMEKLISNIEQYSKEFNDLLEQAKRLNDNKSTGSNG